MGLPAYVYFLFAITVISGILIFYRAAGHSRSFLLIIISWIILQSVVSLSGFYQISDTIPPRFGLLIIPPFLFVVYLFNAKKGRQFIDSLNSKTLTLFHIIRIPIEIVLYWNFLGKEIPELMTFEGRNFDIFSGLSAPFVYYFGFVARKLSKRMLLVWNFLCLALLINIVVNGLLSIPSAFQFFAFEQPNLAVLKFPFVLIPSVLVPLLLFAHLATIRQLLKKNI